MMSAAAGGAGIEAWHSKSVTNDNDWWLVVGADILTDTWVSIGTSDD